MLAYKIQFFRIIVYKFISVNDLVYHNILKQRPRGYFFFILMEHRLGRGGIKNGPKIKIDY